MNDRSPATAVSWARGKWSINSCTRIWPSRKRHWSSSVTGSSSAGALATAWETGSSALFRVFFDYDFMKGAPVYVAALDPHGLLNAWDALAFYVTETAAMFPTLNFQRHGQYPGRARTTTSGLDGTATSRRWKPAFPDSAGAKLRRY